jgi:tetratricopeptide (TPR) repeat protein
MDTVKAQEYQMRRLFISFFVVMVASAGLTAMALAQGGLLSGRITDSETGEPIEGARVVFENPTANPPRMEQTTDANGNYRVLGLNSGQWMLTVEAEGYDPNPGPVNVRQANNPNVDVPMNRIRHRLEVMLGPAAVSGIDIEAVGAEFDAADVAYENQQWEEALAGYQSVSQTLPTLTEAKLQIGNVLQQLERYEEAIAVFEGLVAENPAYEDQMANAIARLRVAMGDLSAAETLASSGAASREDLYNLGEVEFAKGEVDAAAGWYEKAVAIDPNWILPIFKLGLVALNKGDVEGAKTHFSRVVEIDPGSSEGTQAQAVLGQLP